MIISNINLSECLISILHPRILSFAIVGLVTMQITSLFGLVLAISAAAHPGLLYDESHHTHEVLDNIHNTPHCAYTCIFDENYPSRFAPECGKLEGKLEGKELGACLCKANGYQYMLDQCVAVKCSQGERKEVISLIVEVKFRRGK